MPQEKMYIANLAFLLNYTDGKTNDEIAYEIFKVAFQDKETVHYDRSIGGNFRDLEQEPANISVSITFLSNFIQSIYFVNEEKSNDPYIIVGFDDIFINLEHTNQQSSFTAEVNYRLLTDLTQEGKVQL